MTSLSSGRLWKAAAAAAGCSLTSLHASDGSSDRLPFRRQLQVWSPLLALRPGSSNPVRAEIIAHNQSSGPSKKKRVCCIGAGAAGLVCAKELLDQGIEPTVFESREGIGGVWRLDGSGGHVGVRVGQKATSSKYYLGFSDFPIPDTAAEFVSHETYLKYLQDYAEHFSVADRIRFNHKVVDAKQLPDGTWEVVVLSGGRKQTLQFDAVAVCSGLHSTPDFPPKGVPEPPKGFRAEVIHSKDLKDAAKVLKGKRIVIVGGGETGAEMAHIAAEVGVEPALFSLRRGITVIGSYLPLPLADRMPNARTPPVDLNERRIVTLMPHALKNFIFTRDREAVFALRDQNPGKHSLARIVDRTFLALFSMVISPFFILGSVAQDWYKELTHPLFWSTSKPIFQQPNGPAMSQEMQVATRWPPMPPVRLTRDTEQLMEYTRRAMWFRMQGYTVFHYQQIRSLLEEYSGARHTENFLTKSDDFVYNLMDHSLEVRPGIKAYEGTNTVVFDDGSKSEVDIVVWCTGYRPAVPFLPSLEDQHGSSGSLNGTQLFKNVFHPDFGSNLAFVGFARPQLGAMPPLAELQARWLAAVLVGKAQLPTKTAMQAEIDADESRYNNKVFADRMRSTVDFGKYTADIARRAGCYPEMGLTRMMSDFPLWLAFWFGPVLPQSYRVDDDGKRGEDARWRVKETYKTFFSTS